MAAIIGAVGNNGAKLSGVCWKAKIMSVRVLNGCIDFGTSDMVAALEYAWLNGAEVVNCSFTRVDPSQAWFDAFDEVWKHDMLVVASAGNNGENLDGMPAPPPKYPACYPFPNIISVAMTDSSDHLHPQSNYGASSIDLAAPGVNIRTLSEQDYPPIPNLLPFNDFATQPERYWYGTSLATPLVSGAAALVWTAEPSLSAEQVRLRVLAGVRVVPQLAGKVATGGVLDLRTVFQ